jgi:non-specific serine/threonine protein kinase
MALDLARASSSRRVRQTGRLPTQAGSFIGREDQLEQALRLLDETRLLTLTGPGGVGKTRLAGRLAGLLRDRFADGVHWVDLTSVRASALVPAVTLAALGIYEQPDEAALATLVLALAHSSLLLVLDNCEHVLSGAAELVAAVLDGCPGVSILTTSREALAVAGEVRLPVPPMNVSGSTFQAPRWSNRAVEPGTSNLEPERSEAVRLFAARARAVQPRFRLSGSTAPVVTRICRAVDGLPLAIELAAARVRLLTLEQIAARLARADSGAHLHLLAGGPEDAPARHQTLRNAIDWSFALLAPAEQILLRRLGVFAGTFNLEATERICADDVLPGSMVLDLLGALVDKSLVTVASRSDEARYRLLEPVRLYALERLTGAWEDDAVRGRHARYFLELASQWRQVSPALPVRGLMDCWQAEHAELRAALEWSSRAGAAQRAAWLTAVDDLAAYWQARGQYSDARRWVAEARREADAAAAALRGAVLVTAGWLAFKTGDIADAQGLAEAACELASATGDPMLRGRALCLRAWLASLHGDTGAHHISGESVALLRDQGVPAELGLALLIHAGALALAGDPNAALATTRETLALAEELDYEALIGTALLTLAQVQRHAGDLTGAAERLVRALTVLPTNDSFTLSYALEELCMIAMTLGLAEQAARLAGAAERYRSDSGMRRAPVDHRDFVPALDAARSVLGERAFQAAFERGRGRSLDGALQRARTLARTIATRGASRSASVHRHSGRRDGRRAQVDHLTRREVDVLRLIAAGRVNQTIAADLGISLNTVERHINHIFAKAGVSNRVAAVNYARQHGLVP